jgi:hypothetical protein
MPSDSNDDEDSPRLPRPWGIYAFFAILLIAIVWLALSAGRPPEMP